MKSSSDAINIRTETPHGLIWCLRTSLHKGECRRIFHLWEKTPMRCLKTFSLLTSKLVIRGKPVWTLACGKAASARFAMMVRLWLTQLLTNRSFLRVTKMPFYTYPRPIHSHHPTASTTGECSQRIEHKSSTMVGLLSLSTQAPTQKWWRRLRCVWRS